MSQELTKIPKLADLLVDPETSTKRDELNYLLNQPVPKVWVKKHPIIKIKNDSGQMVPLEYIPVDKQKFLIRRVFKRFRVEIIDKGIMFQSVFVHVRIHFPDPITNEWDFHDGIGAVGVQTDSGKSAADLAAIKSDAVMKALPAAHSYAIKNACDNFGTLFGDGLNKTVAEFAQFAPPQQTAPVQPSSEPTQFDQL